MNQSDSTIARKPFQIETISAVFENDPKLTIENMEFRSLSMFVGANASGKSLILKWTWICGFIGAARFAMGSSYNESIIKELSSTIINNVFDSPHFTGYFKAEYSNGATVEFRLLSGQPMAIIFTKFDEIEEFIPTQFLSSNMRLFSSISFYLYSRRQYLQSISFNDALPELMKQFKMHDIMHIEQLIARCPVEINSTAMTALKSSFGFESDYKILDVDLDQADFFLIDDKGEKTYTKQLSNGQQAIINMTLTIAPA